MPAGWYRDHDPSKMRWWDGASWTERVKNSVPSQVRPATGQAVVDDRLRERNRSTVVALIVSGIGAAIVPMVAMTFVPIWPGLGAVLAAGVFALVLAAVAITRPRRIGRGLAPAVIAIVLGVLLIVTALVAAAMVLVSPLLT
ncbi:hypothetical protein GCM10022240_05100 [Microbacterium kribbense]|uniref:DUF2510 domain-containing protein n=2 Tax=Microbacterium kribbense TaxID=433645 RepID=A0ABP7G6L0_9MICO